MTNFIRSSDFSYSSQVVDNSPVLAAQSSIGPSDIASVTSEKADHPAVNIVNDATFLRWESTNIAQQILVFDIPGGAVDYLAIAKHNLGSVNAQLTVAVDDGTGWSTISASATVTDDSPIMYVFNRDVYERVRIVIRYGDAGETYKIGVLKIGRRVDVRGTIYVGHSPAPLNRSVSAYDAFSEGGEFLGRTLTGKTSATTVDLADIDPVWYRANLDAFFSQAEDTAAFFFWRPGDRPTEGIYGVVTTNPNPSNQRPNGMMQVNFSIKGIA